MPAAGEQAAGPDPHMFHETYGDLVQRAPQSALRFERMPTDRITAIPTPKPYRSISRSLAVNAFSDATE